MIRINRINHQKTMKISVIGIVWKIIWSCTYHTPKHLVELYQVFIKEKGRRIEMSFVDHNDPMSYLDSSNGVNFGYTSPIKLYRDQVDFILQGPSGADFILLMHKLISNQYHIYYYTALCI